MHCLVLTPVMLITLTIMRPLVLNALIILSRTFACRLLSKQRRSSSKQSSSQRHRSSNKQRRRQQLLLLLLLLLVLMLLTMMMMLTMTYQIRYVVHTVDLNRHSFPLRDFTVTSTNLQYVRLTCQMQGWMNHDSAVIDLSNELFKEVDRARYGNH